MYCIYIGPFIYSGYARWLTLAQAMWKLWLGGHKLLIRCGKLEIILLLSFIWWKDTFGAQLRALN